MAFPDFAQLRRQLVRSIDRQVRTNVESSVRSGFELAKQELLDYISDHQISLELDLKEELFGFFGFNSSDNPVDELLNYLDNQIQLSFLHSGDLKSRVLITFPNKDDLRNGGILSLPWEPGKSWVEGVELGFTNFDKFLAKENVGRSQQGIQVKASVNSFTFKPTPYLSEGLKRFRENLNKYLRR